MPIIEFHKVFYIKEEKNILQNITMTVERGDCISVVGPSGSGKSTLLKLCSHLISPSKGNIIIENRSIFDYETIELRRKVCYCFQTPYLFGDTVMDNISFPFDIRNSKVDIKRAEQLFSSFGLDSSYINKEVKNLSGGEKQRIALIRSLLIEPQILLLDEVTSSLDKENTSLVEGVIKDLNKQGMTVLWVTHNPEQSKRIGNKIINLEGGEIILTEVIR